MSDDALQQSSSVEKMLKYIAGVSSTLAAVVSLGIITSTIWYAAIAANDLTHAVTDANNNITKMYSILEKKEAEDEILKLKVDVLEQNQTQIMNTRPVLVHLEKKFAVMESPEGAIYRLTLYGTDEDL